MKIYLVRHGTAVSPEISPEKPLSPQGKEDIEKIARFLGTKGIPLFTILHSHKLRAKQTAEIFRAFIAPGLNLETNSHLNPDDDIDYIVERLQAEEADCMVVGHLPFLSKLLGHLVAGDENLTLVDFHPGTTVCVERIDQRLTIEWVLTKELLRSDSIGF